MRNDARDYFSVLGFPRQYEISPADLERKYIALARDTHPDLAGDDPDAQADALEKSAALNEAHRVLADDEARANHLLELLGGPGPEADKSLPEGFLPIIMMTREELADAQMEGDAERVSAIEADARAQRAARLAEIGRLFGLAQRGIAQGDRDALTQIRVELNALRYYQRLLEQSRPDHKPAL